MDPPSERSLDAEIFSSPIPNHNASSTGYGLRTSDYASDSRYQMKESSIQKKKRKNSRNDYIEDDDEISTWSPAKRQAWESRKTNPNAFYYRHVEPGLVKRTGLWDQSEKEAFMRALKLHPPTQGKWGLFAMNIPGRVGYQCRNFYHRLLETGELTEDPVPDEYVVKKVKGSNQKKAAKNSKKFKMNIEMDESDEDSEEENEVDVAIDIQTDVTEEDIAEEEKNEVPEIQISSIKFYSSRVQKEEERIKREAEFAQAGLGVVEDHNTNPIDVVEATVELLARIVGVNDPIIADEYHEQGKVGANDSSNYDNSIFEENPFDESSSGVDDDEVANEHDNGNIILPIESHINRSKYEHQCSKILSYNSLCQLNLILLAFPAPKDLKVQYIESVKDRLARNESKKLFSEALRKYFKIKDAVARNPSCQEEMFRNFANDFIGGLV